MVLLNYWCDPLCPHHLGRISCHVCTYTSYYLPSGDCWWYYTFPIRCPDHYLSIPLPLAHPTCDKMWGSLLHPFAIPLPWLWWAMVVAITLARFLNWVWVSEGTRAISFLWFSLFCIREYTRNLCILYVWFTRLPNLQQERRVPSGDCWWFHTMPIRCPYHLLSIPLPLAHQICNKMWGSPPAIAGGSS